MAKGIPFDFDLPVSFFEKADASIGKQRRIGGLVSVETRDQADELILQRGLDFTSAFLPHGWFNDNHSRDTDGILGYPEKIKYVNKGTKLPNGQMAKAAGHWVEGYLLNTKKADRIWELGQALQNTNRRLGFSVEGKIFQRADPAKKTIAKALVRNVAITNCPVHPDARMELLTKSLYAVEQADPDALLKALGMGDRVNNDKPMGPKTGAEAGQVLVGQSLEDALKITEWQDKEKKKKDKKTKKSMAEHEIYAWIGKRLPHATSEQTESFITLTKALKRLGKL